VTVETVVRSVSAGLPAAIALPIVGIFSIRPHLETLTKRKANKSHEDNQCEKRSNPIRHDQLR
jgi:hypothetical protein